MVSVNPGTLATPVHTTGASTRVTVNLSGGWPFTRIVIFAPTANGPSILAITMTSPGHSAGFVHTAHTSAALAEEWDDPPNGPFASPMSVIFPRFALPLRKKGETGVVSESLKNALLRVAGHRDSVRFSAYTSAMFSETRYALNGDLHIAYRASGE